ncbi:MAG: restriction endonuclease subunit S [Actinomycetaceae bacterium]|nr:restriction endonuclease subunit S [Actinomycetaceae bacterium]
MFDHIEQGQRLKKDDQLPGTIPFVMSGVTNTGVVGYISNPVASFPSNSITIDIFGNSFYRNYEYGAGDDTGVYWNENQPYSSSVLLFMSATIGKSLYGMFSYGNKLRSSRSLDITVKLPTKNGEIDFDFMEDFVAELEAQRLAELEAYLQATGLHDYSLTPTEIEALGKFDSIDWGEYRLGDLFEIKTNPQLDKRNFTFTDVQRFPYFTRTSSSNGIAGYVEHLDDSHLIPKGCLAVGMIGMQFFYMDKDFYAGQFTKRAVPKGFALDRYLALFFTSLLNKFGSVFQSVLVRNFESTFSRQTIKLPTKNDEIDFDFISTFITAIQKLVIKDVVDYADRKIAATRTVIKSHA